MAVQQFTAYIDIPTLTGEEDGVWTPVIGGDSETGQVYHYQTGHYTRIGKLVHVWAYTQFTDQGAITGNLALKNLPFPTKNAPGFFAGCCGYFSNLAPTAALTSLLVYTGGAQTHVGLFGIEQGKYMNPRPLVGADVNMHSQFIISFAYPTD